MSKNETDILRFISLVVEELTDKEIDYLDVGNSLIDPELNVVTVDGVVEDEATGDVLNVDVIRYAAPEEEMEEPRLYRKTVDNSELKNYDLA